MSISKTFLATSVAALLGIVSQSASALDLSKVTMRVRVINIEPADKSDAIGALNGPVTVLMLTQRLHGY